MDEPIVLGVSACLLGQPVRYDGGHKLDRFLTEELAPHVRFVPVCPETEAGLSVPRESMRLMGDPGAPRLLGNSTGRDFTDTLSAWAVRRVEELAGEKLCGYVLKSRSPSCGMARVKVHPFLGGSPALKGVGLFARPLLERFPLLPVEEEGRLNDPKLRENFIERLFVMRRWRRLLENRHTPEGRLPGALMAFQASHKLLVMSHAPADARAMGKLTAEAKTLPEDELLRRYQTLLLSSLAKPATTAKHTNVLQHIAGYFRGKADEGDRAELAEVIDLHHRGLVPLIVPVTLCAHHARKHNVEYLLDQYYLHPHPVELKLRNHV